MVGLYQLDTPKEYDQLFECLFSFRCNVLGTNKPMYCDFQYLIIQVVLGELVKLAG